jgi:hypothetical protein
MSAAAAAAVNEDKMIDELITDLDNDLAKQKPVAAPAKPKSTAAPKYDVFKSIADVSGGAAPTKAPSLDALLASYGPADAGVVSLCVSVVKPYGTAFLVKQVAPPAAPVLKRLAKALGAEKALEGVAAPKEADYAVMLKPGKKIEKKKTEKEAKPEGANGEVRKRIKANLDKLKAKEKKAKKPVTTA